VYLAYEGAEKILDYFLHKKEKKEFDLEVSYTEEEILAHESKKIKSAIVVDFILSIEIVIIALSTVVEKPLHIQIAVVSIVAILATVGVYGMVALIVKMDDLGFKLISLNSNKKSPINKLGRLLVNTLPVVIRGLAVVGTLAMLLVAGGIFMHHIHFIHHLMNALPMILGELIVGLVVGLVAFILVKAVSWPFTKKH
jgi:predicted DNA repair protein MutK